jgi:hypothetical protein
LKDRFAGKADFVGVYIREAHPTDEWQMDSNVEQGVCYPQPRTLEERLAIARDFVAREKWEIPLLVDGIENQVDWVFAGWPERLYVVETDGTIAYKGKTGPFGFHPEEVEAWLERKFPDVPKAAVATTPER